MSKIKKSRKEFLAIANTLGEIKGMNDTTFNMYVLLNLKKLNSFIEELKIVLDESDKPEKIEEYSDKEAEVMRKYGEKDSEGNLISSGQGQYRIVKDNIEPFRKAKEALDTEYADTVAQIKVATENRNRLLNEEVEIEIVSIPLNVFPKEFDTNKQETLLDFIDSDIK